MEEEKYLILIDGQERTLEIASCESTDSSVKIIFLKSPTKPYYYALERVRIFTSPIISELQKNEILYVKGIKKVSVRKVFHFQNQVRIIFQNNKRELYPSVDVEMIQNKKLSASAKHTIRYWQEISEEIRLPNQNKEEDSFLKKQMLCLDLIRKESVLGAFLQKETIARISFSKQEPIFPFRFNLSQYQAVDHAMSNAISVIEGPPGTGKTQTILNIVANLVIQGLNVAVVSSNNSAVQNVKDKLDASGYGFLVASLGNRENQQNFFAAPPEFSLVDYRNMAEQEDLSLLQNQLEEIAIRIRGLMESENERAILRQEVQSYRLEYEHFQNYFKKQNVERIGKLSFYKQSSEKALNFLADSQIAKTTGKSEGWVRKVKLVLLHGFTDFEKLKQNEIDVLLEYQLMFYDLKIKELDLRIAEIDSLLEKMEFKDITSEHQAISEKIFKILIYRKYQYDEPIKETIHSYKQNMERFMQAYPIVLSTAQSLLNCARPGFLFDYVIVDESSQVNLLEGALALSACKNVVIVGDTRQLPQIVERKLEQKFAEANQTIDSAFQYFNQSLLTSMIDVYDDFIPKTMLKEHYRCHPKIIGFCNAKYYDNKLITFTNEEEQEVPLKIYRTVEGNHMREITQGENLGKFNRRELDVIENEVLINLKDAIQRNADLGFVTPYRKQADQATSQFDQEIESDTVHKYQGREKSTMIMSTVLDQTRQGNMGLKFVNDPCMLNVAVSRAQKRFILVTGHSMFRESTSEVGDLIRYMEYSTMDQHIVESELVSIFDLLYSSYSKKLNSLEARLKGDSRYKSENILNTVLAEILDQESYRMLEYTQQVYLKNLFQNVEKLTQEEQQYIKNRASVDFVVYHKLDKKPLLAIEVDGFASHDNKPSQLLKDRLKDHIFESYGLSLIRYKTNEISDEFSISAMLNKMLEKYKAI